MLRQALDAASGLQQNNELEAQSATESDSLLPGSQDQLYAATSISNDEYDLSVSGSYEDEEYIIQEWDDETESVPEEGLLEKAWKRIKACFILVVNVENLWDSPAMHGPQVSRRNHLVVLFWFFILASSYACERSTFKLLVDRTGPFRLFAVEMVTFMHALMVGTGMFISAFVRKNFSMQALGIPIVDVGRKFFVVIGYSLHVCCSSGHSLTLPHYIFSQSWHFLIQFICCLFSSLARTLPQH